MGTRIFHLLLKRTDTSVPDLDVVVHTTCKVSDFIFHFCYYGKISTGVV